MSDLSDIKPGDPGTPVHETVTSVHPESEMTRDALLTCPKCDHFISGADLDIDKTIATCGNCHHVFGFVHDSTTGALKAERLMPEGVEVLKLKSELDIRLEWKKTTTSGGRKFILIFATIWNLMLLPFILSIVLSGSWSLLLFISLHLLAGLSMIWYLAAVYLNQTSISVTSRRIRIHSFPIRHPFYKAREIPTSRLSQLYLSKYTQSTTNGVPNYAWALYAVLDDGEKVSLLRGMNEATQAYLEGEIESFLGIRDAPVEGEHG